MEHECIIGMLNRSEYSELATLSDLQKHIEDQREFNRSLDDDPLLRNCKNLRARCWTLKSYCDRRVNTDLERFTFCPECGKKIDWKAIKELGQV